MASKRLQLQERIGSDVAQIMTEAAGTDDVAVIIHGTHSCMSARGIKKEAASTVTTTLRGRFETDAMLQNQLYMMLGRPINPSRTRILTYHSERKCTMQELKK